MLLDNVYGSWRGTVKVLQNQWDKYIEEEEVEMGLYTGFYRDCDVIDVLVGLGKIMTKLWQPNKKPTTII